MNLPKVNIIIPCLNEGKVISRALEAILNQEENGFILNDIYVISDGSTDNTVEIVRSYNKSNVKVIEHKDRKGQLVRLNEGFRFEGADFIIQTDGDCEFGNTKVISEIISEFRNPKVMMVAGNAQPRSPKNFIERGICSTYLAYSNAAAEMNYGHNIWMVHGCILAFRREFIKDFEVPSQVVVQDWYMYLRCINEGYLFRYAKNATVFFSVPSTVIDHIKQVKRYISTASLLHNFFAEKIIRDSTKQNIFKLFKHQVIQFTKAPIETLFVFILNRFVEVDVKLFKVKPTATWERVLTKL